MARRVIDWSANVRARNPVAASVAHPVRRVRGAERGRALSGAVKLEEPVAKRVIRPDPILRPVRCMKSYPIFFCFSFQVRDLLAGEQPCQGRSEAEPVRVEPVPQKWTGVQVEDLFSFSLRWLERGEPMSRRLRRNHRAEFKSKVALAAMRGEQTLSELAGQLDVTF